jgi:hypothetical protein
VASPNTNGSTTVNFFYDAKAKPTHQAQHLTQANIREHLRATCRLKPKNYYGYAPEEIGTHSLRSGAAMALFLADEHPHKIMLLGRWSSDAFLDYIRPQVQEWTSGMSTLMLAHDMFHTAAHADISIPQRKNDKVHPDDPRTSGDKRSRRGSIKALSLLQHGSTVGNYIIPRLHIFH